MRFLLTSAGIKNASIHDALVDLLGKPFAECDALCIPTASYGHPMAGPAAAWRFISGREPRCPMCELGWKSLGVLELTALPSIDEAQWVPLVQETDVLLANGGDALYLSHWMQQSGLADLLPSQRAVWVGLSGGSMVMAPNVGEEPIRWKPPTGGDRALGLVDFSIFPHVDHEQMPDNSMAHAEEWAASCRCRGTRSTTRPRSRWSTVPSRSSPRDTGSRSPLSARWCAAGRRKRPWPGGSGDRRAAWSPCGKPDIAGSSTCDRS